MIAITIYYQAYNCWTGPIAHSLLNSTPHRTQHRRLNAPKQLSPHSTHKTTSESLIGTTLSVTQLKLKERLDSGATQVYVLLEFSTKLWHLDARDELFWEFLLSTSVLESRKADGHVLGRGMDESTGWNWLNKWLIRLLFCSINHCLLLRRSANISFLLHQSTD